MKDAPALFDMDTVVDPEVLARLRGLLEKPGHALVAFVVSIEENPDRFHVHHALLNSDRMYPQFAEEVAAAVYDRLETEFME